MILADEEATQSNFVALTNLGRRRLFRSCMTSGGEILSAMLGVGLSDSTSMVLAFDFLGTY